MKTVQEYLKILDETKLDNVIKLFLSRLCQNLDFFESNDTRLFIKTCIKVQEYIKRLIGLEIQPTDDGSTPVLYAYETITNSMYYTDSSFGLVHLDEIKEDVENARDYDYRYQSQNEIMGYWISDAPYTQNNICELLVDVLYEAALFGYENEHLEEEREYIVRVLKKGEQTKFSSHNTLFELCEDILEEKASDMKVKDELAEKLKKEAMNAIIEFDKYSRIIERKKLLDLL